jgi:uncharacterized membrane protein
MLTGMARYDLNYMVRKVLAVAVNREMQNMTAYDIAIICGTGLNYAYLIRKCLMDLGVLDERGRLDLEAAKKYLGG